MLDQSGELQQSFNSTLVRSRRRAPLRIARPLDSFNSTLVRSRRRKSRRAHFTIITFQFHIGSIKAVKMLRITRRADGFQFHIGSIKAKRIHALRADDLRFNSTLVRSRPFQCASGAARAGVSIPHWFDQGISSASRFSLISWFQFHIGSIKALRPFVFSS